jgi:uroporphyrin-3 C-methyltransferase
VSELPEDPLNKNDDAAPAPRPAVPAATTAAPPSAPETAPPATPIPVTPPSHPLRQSRGWIIGAVVFGTLAVGAAVMAWNTQQRVRLLEQELARRQQASGEQATEAQLLARQASDGVRDLTGKLGVLEDRVAESALQRSQVEELIQSLSRSRDENVLADVEAALRVAMQQAALTGSADPITSVLKQADERLARYNQPRLERVRRAVARDLDRTRTTPAIDVPSLTIRLDEVIRLVDELPLLATPERVPAAAASVRAASAAAASAASAAAADSARKALLHDDWLDAASRAWRWFGTEAWGEVRALVRVTKIEHPEAMLVTPEQAFFLRENLKLRLLNARLSLLSRQFDQAQADLHDAQGTVDRYFDHGSRRVVAAADLLRQVSTQARQVTFARPDDTLAALSAAQAGR